MERLLTTQETADYLRLKPATVLRMLRRGELSGRKIGRIWRIFPGNFPEIQQAGSVLKRTEAMFTITASENDS